MTQATLQYPALSLHLPIGSLDAYIYQANQIPILTLEEEQQHAKRYLQDGDLEAARQLVMAHLRYVVRVARGYIGYGLPLGDLIQEGNVGLMKAVKRFDPAFGVRLVSFAVHWIKAEIHEFIVRNWRIVKIATTKAQRKLFFNLRSMKKRLGWFTQQEVAEVAQDLGVTCADVLAMEQRLNAIDASFDGYSADDDDDYLLAPSETLSAPNSDPLEIVMAHNTDTTDRDALVAALRTLDERSQDILYKRWLNEKKSTLHELAAEYGVSAERIRQLEQNAMKKIREALEQD